jgi:hypothetical protein
VFEDIHALLIVFYCGQFVQAGGRRRSRRGCGVLDADVFGLHVTGKLAAPALVVVDQSAFLTGI